MMRWLWLGGHVQATMISAAELGQLFLELHRAMHRIVDQAMTTAGLSLSRAKVLLQLSEHGPMNQAAIATALGFAARSVTDTVDGLERDGFAVRTADPNDRRVRIVDITSAGAVALKSALAAKEQAMEKIFGSLGAPARARFAALLSSINAEVLSLSGEAGVE